MGEAPLSMDGTYCSAFIRELLMGSVAIARNDSVTTPGSATADRCLTALYLMLHFPQGRAARCPRWACRKDGCDIVTAGFPPFGRQAGRELVPLASAMALGAPGRRAALAGPESVANAVGARSAAKGEGAAATEEVSAMPTAKRSAASPPLMPFLFLPRICSFSGRSRGFLLTVRG